MLDRVPVGSQAAPEFLHVAERRLDQVAERTRLAIDRNEGVEPGRELAQPVDDRPLGLVQSVVERARKLDQLLGMREAAGLRLERLIFIRFEPGSGDLIPLEAQVVRPFTPLTRGAARVLETSLDGAQPRVGSLRLGGQCLVSAIGVQNPPLPGAVQESLVIVLSVEVEEPAPELAQPSRRRRRPVHPCPMPALATQFATQDEPAFFMIDTGLLAQRPQSVDVLDLEAALDAGGPGARPDHVRRRPPSDEEREGFDEEGLPRPRLAAEHAETRPEFERSLLDDGEVPDAKLSQHASFPRPARMGASGARERHPTAASASGR